jgi:hypothetical protein
MRGQRQLSWWEGVTESRLMVWYLCVSLCIYIACTNLLLFYHGGASRGALSRRQRRLRNAQDTLFLSEK